LLVGADVSFLGVAVTLAPVASAAVAGAAFPPFAGLLVAAGVGAAVFGLMLEIDLISTCVLS
jgi:ABC-type glucose/galactose transport system permease subunit